MLGIFDRYIARETAMTWVAVAAVLVLVVVVNRFAVYLGQAAAGQIPAFATFALLGLSVIGLLEIIVPVSLFLAIVISLGRYYRDQEAVAAFACGLTPARLYRPIGLLGGIAAVLLAVLALWATPWAHATAHRMEVGAHAEAQISVMEAGRFKMLGGGKGVFYAGGVNSKTGLMHPIFAELDERNEGEQPLLITARNGRLVVQPQTGERHLDLGPGRRYQGRAGSLNWTVTHFQSARLLVQPPGRPAKTSTDYDRMSTAVLLSSPEPGARATLEWRLLQPFTALLLMLIAVPLAHMRPRQGRYARLVPAILVYLVYFNLLGVARIWAAQPGWGYRVGLWWVPAAALIFGLILLKQRFGSRRVRAQGMRHAD
ncbi:MAG TPA: LPS export ABC transporter permease LptF [Gammaproteobacteria bacterium]|nr:LPS export ABC transporter permease LptF [Gammaproteobacteria bacterium]